jgi:hypothetical protein
MGTFSAALAGLLMLMEQNTVVVTTGPHYNSPKYHQIDYETACESIKLRFRFRQGPEESGRVDHVLIDGRPVRDAAEILQMRAARRLITSIEILDCGKDSQRPVILGMMNLEPMESRRLGMQSSLVFRLSLQGREGWQISID